MDDRLEVGFKDVSIAVPAFNEAPALAKVLTGLQAACSDAEVIVINDGSTDDTGAIAKAHADRVITHKRNLGYGASWKTALRHASREIIVFFDGDDQFDPVDVARAVATMRETDADMVVGQRGADSHGSRRRKPGKAIIRMVASYLSGERINDPNCGLRCVKRKLLLGYADLLPDGFSASTTSLILMLKRGYLVEYLPLTVRKRIGTSSVRQIRDGLGVLVLITRLVALFAPLRIFLPVSVGLGVAGVLYSVVEALVTGRGVPVLGATLIIGSILSYLLGVVSDQISALRLSQFRPENTELID